MLEVQERPSPSLVAGPHREQVGKMALEWDLSQPIAYLVQRRGMKPGYVEEMALEYRRFMSIVAQNPGREFAISEQADTMWHTHILFSQDYVNMSEALCGAYMHHFPLLNEADREALLPNYRLGTMVEYERLYGIPNPTWWPENGQVCK